MNRKLYFIGYSEYKDQWYAEVVNTEDWASFELNPLGFDQKINKFNFYVTLTVDEAKKFIDNLNKNVKVIKYTCKKCGRKYLNIEGEESNHICKSNGISIHLGSR